MISHEKEIVEKMTKVSFIGSKESVTKQIKDLQKRVKFEELIVNSYIYDEKAQYHSYKLLAEVIEENFKE